MKDKNELFDKIKNLFSSSDNNVSDIDLKRYTNLEDMYGYVGFIDKEGGFYRVREIGSTNCGHGEWAYYFLDSIKNKTGFSPSLKFYNNINFLLSDPRFEMAFLYEVSDNSMGINSKIDYCASVGDIDMPIKQKEVINHLVEYQDKKADLFTNKSNMRSRI